MLRLLALLSLSAVAAFSQATTATIQGVVHDQTGAIVPGVSVTITNLETQVSSKWVSGPEGNFTAPFLQPGEYEVAVEKAGLQNARCGVESLCRSPTPAASMSRSKWALPPTTVTRDRGGAVGESGHLRTRPGNPEQRDRRVCR